MKKSAKKLQLSRETLRDLQDKRLDKVAGGASENCTLTCGCTETCFRPISICICP